jgi:ubiquinone/menaquinone biosynthesis C-methylase UbiE
MNTDAEELKQRYEEFARSLDYRTTACDHHLRELEIETASGYMRDGMTILDVGCGLGYAITQYASRFQMVVHGIDYSNNMIEGARKLMQKNCPDLIPKVEFKVASVVKLPHPDATFDVVTSHRCLMALLDWGMQKKALLEIHRVLKPGGKLILMEGTFEGLERLNTARSRFGLEAISADGRDRLITLKFHEPQLLDFSAPYFKVERIQRFGMYYFLTRVIHPLLVAPDKPTYDHKLNQIAREVARVIPDYDGMGHLVAFVLSKHGQDG